MSARAARAGLERVPAPTTPGKATAVVWVLIAVLGAAGDLRAQALDPLAEVRAHYLAAIQDPAAIARALRAIEARRPETGTQSPGPTVEAVLRAYRGAIEVVRAKHGWWPPARVRQVHGGVAQLNRLVEDHPLQAEIRYLRLVSTFHLPAFLRPERTVREDLDALGRLLPEGGESLPEEMRESMIRFVLSHGTPDEAVRQRLERVLRNSRN